MRRQPGQQLPEYAIIIALIVLVSIPALISLGKNTEKPLNQLATSDDLDKLVGLVSPNPSSASTSTQTGEGSQQGNTGLQVGATHASYLGEALQIGDGPGVNTTSVDGQQSGNNSNSTTTNADNSQNTGNLGSNPFNSFSSGNSKGKTSGSPSQGASDPKDLRLVANLADRIAKLESRIDQLNLNDASKASLRKYVDTLSRLQANYVKLGDISPSYAAMVPIYTRIGLIEEMAYNGYLSNDAINAKIMTIQQYRTGKLPAELQQLTNTTPKPRILVAKSTVTSIAQTTTKTALELKQLAN